MKLEYIVTEENKYANLKEILKCHFEISERFLAKLKRNQKILLNGIPVSINSSIDSNDSVLVDLDFEEESENIVALKMDLNILYEDEALLIINKPSNCPVHPSILHFEDSLSNGVKFYFNSINLYKKIRPVNRLDKDTSGIVIFAKNEYIQEALIKQMKKKFFKKEYLSILEGHLEKACDTINAPIARKKGSIIEREINLSGEHAVTHYELIKNFTKNNKNLSLVKFILETGRTHQIRLHSRYIGHPILGDSLYGNSSVLISRQALHAYKTTFIHPITKKTIFLETDLPEDIKKIII